MSPSYVVLLPVKPPRRAKSRRGDLPHYHLGRRVLISVKNSTEPIEGSLAQIAEDGVLLEQGDERVAISYLRITNIEIDPAQS